MKNFQLISIIVFIALAVFGILVFSGAIPIGKNKTPGALGTVVLWGTVRGVTMAPILEEFNNANPTFVVRYVEKSSTNFDQDLLEALASGTGPDMFFLSDSLAFHYANAIIYPPIFLDEFASIVPIITKKDDSNKIIKSTVALGHFSNVTHAKDILSAFFMQTGNKIVTEKDGVFSSSL